MKRSATLLMLLATCTAAAGELREIRNYTAYSEYFASAGQPDEQQLRDLQAAGFERIVYIAWTDNSQALPNEDRLVKSLGMEYLHIPVDWAAPTAADFKLFAGAMQAAPQRRTLLHCQANYRASAFSFLYRVIYDEVPVAEAKQDMNAVWTPNDTWRELIFAVLAEHGISPHCDGCDWASGEH